MKNSLPQAAYDELADSYAALVDTKPHNAYYDRPGVQSLLGDLDGQDVLDAGCGTGVYTEWLLDRGARVVGLDANEKMLGHARKRVGTRAKFHLANLEEPLEFLDHASFDGVVSPLVLTYCNDLRPIFAEFRRVLRAGGWLVFSTEHPFFSYRLNGIENYYNTKEVSYLWQGFGKPVEMKSYYHSLGTITGALSDNGFLIEKLTEPFPTEDFARANPQSYQELMRFPLFIFVRAVKWEKRV